MPDDFNPYREWLGCGNDRAPNYYELLGVSSGESDQQQIAAAAERTRTKVRSFRPGPRARAWSQLLDEIQAAKECLCDAAKKAAYDAELASAKVNPKPAAANPDLFPPSIERAALPASSQGSPAESPIVALPMAVPVGDLIASPASIVKHVEPALFDPMIPLEAEVDLPPGADPQLSPTTDIEADYLPQAFVPSVVDASVPDDVRPRMEQPVAISSAPTAVTVAAQRQKQAGRGFMLFLVAALSLVAGAGGAYLVLSNWPMSPNVRSPNAPAAVAIVPDPTTATGPPRTGDSSATAPSDVNIAESPRSQAPPAAPLAPPPEAPPPAPAVPSLPSASLPSSAVPSPQPQVTLEQVQTLIKALEAAKVAFAEQNFALANAEIEKAASLAVLPKHKEAVARLKEVGGYVKQFREAVVAAVNGMQAGETFKVGNSTHVSFVEGFNDKVILRIAGMNRAYPFNDLPPGLAVAIADFKLPQSSPMSRVVKGAYLLLHKRADGETQEKGRALWQEAQAAGANIGHLMPFFNDNYADFIKDATSTGK